MKITFLLTWGDAMGGTERAVLRQASWLAERHDVEVLSVFRTQDTPAFAIDPRVRMTYLVDTRESLHRPARRELSDELCRVLSATPSELVRPQWEQAFTRLADLELERVLRECSADIVVSTTPALMAVMTELVPRRVVTVHQEHRVAELRGSSGNPLRLFSARLDAIVLLSEPTRAWFASLFGDAAPRLAIIPNSIDDGYRPRSSRTSPSIVMAGRLTGEKQFSHAISAFAQVADDHPDWSLRIFGDGARRELENQIIALGLGEQVQLMGPTTSIDNEWAKAAIAMVTSRVESFGLTIVEAMAAAVPVVSYDCPNGPREIIEHDKTGLLVAPNNTDALAVALRQIIEDEELRHTMGEAAAIAVERFSPDVVMALWEQLYAELLTGRDDANWVERRTFALALHQAQNTDAGVVSQKPSESAAPEVDAWTAATRELRPGLVWSRGQLTQVRDDMTPHETATANLDLTVAALEAANVDYFLVRQATPTYRVAVREADRIPALTAIARTAHDRAAYIEGFDVRHRTLGSWPAALGDTVEQLRTAASVRIFEPVITTSHTMRIGAIYGCELEFWTPSEDGSELTGPAPTLAGNPLAASSLTPALITIGNRAYQTVEPFTRKLVSDLTFPVDAVYTWVDGDDPAWLDRKQAALGERHTGDDADRGHARFRSRDELRFSLRSLDLFAPWINQIWIVTDRQTPSWLDVEHPRIHVVDHREVFTEPALLPTFNSHAIETQLHHIEGLSEHFLYLNDDVFFGRLLGPNMFFNAGGLPKTFASRTQIPLSPISDTDEAFAVAARNNRALLEQAYGRTLIHGFLHTPHAHRRSTLTAVETEFAEAVRQTAGNRTRSATDVSMLSSLAHHFGLITGQAVEGSIRCGFVNVGIAEHHPRLKALLQRRNQDVFCLNDYHDGDVPAEDQARIIEAFLPAYFPIPSQFELGSERNQLSPDQRQATRRQHAK